LKLIENDTRNNPGDVDGIPVIWKVVVPSYSDITKIINLEDNRVSQIANNTEILGIYDAYNISNDPYFPMLKEGNILLMANSGYFNANGRPGESAAVFKIYKKDDDKNGDSSLYYSFIFSTYTNFKTVIYGADDYRQERDSLKNESLRWITDVDDSITNSSDFIKDIFDETEGEKFLWENKGIACLYDTKRLNATQQSDEYETSKNLCKSTDIDKDIFCRKHLQYPDIDAQRYIVRKKLLEISDRRKEIMDRGNNMILKYKRRILDYYNIVLYTIQADQHVYYMIEETESLRAWYYMISQGIQNAIPDDLSSEIDAILARYQIKFEYGNLIGVYSMDTTITRVPKFMIYKDENYSITVGSPDEAFFRTKIGSYLLPFSIV
jgi:hypothetical protein